MVSVRKWTMIGDENGIIKIKKMCTMTILLFSVCGE